MYASLQSAPQLIPAGLEVTVPLPSPPLLTVRVKRSLNVAVTVRADDIVTVHVGPATVSHPLQPVNVDPEMAVAVSVTELPLTYGSEQSAPQVIPPGFEVMVPAPPPALAAVSVNNSLKVAVAVRAALIVTVHVAPATVSHPLQPVNVDPEMAAAVSVTEVPLA